MAALLLAALLLPAALPDADTLGIIDNALRHEAPPPRAAPPIVRELLARPLDALDAAALYERVVPHPVRAFDPAADAPAQPFERLLGAYLAELALAQAELLAATGNAPIDEIALAREAALGALSADRTLQLAAAIDSDGLAVANERFLAATLRFALALRTATGVPPETTRFRTAAGTIVIGSRGDDLHELAPATHGTASVVIDLGGNDTYRGSDVALRGFSAIVDLAGDDRYEMSGSGLGAAIAGAALLLDLSGEDSYRVPHFGQGAAVFGVGVLLDFAGNDRYDLDAWGQGLGMAGGIGLLRDAAGNDTYAARGPADGFDRGGGLSGAQGAAMGLRTMLAGGIGILRDDGGDDTYTAEMFAQGTGYYYGLGVLWDRGGADRYDAVRYAQGNGVHEAVGVLRDESGNDRYSLKVGVGQGMGLDYAVGALVDRAGDDRYFAGLLAQGSATANGIGVLQDAGGADRFEIGSGERQWGHAEWLRGMPSTGLFLADLARASFVSAGQPLAAPPAPRTVHEQDPPAACPPGVAVGAGDLARLRRDHFDAVYEMGQRLRCVAEGEPGAAAALWRELDAELARDPGTPLAVWIAAAYRAKAPPSPLAASILRRLESHPWCSVRAIALGAAPRADAARAALGSSCWRLQAQALRVLEKLGAPAPAGAAPPSFLR